MSLTEFKEHVKRIYNGNIKWKENGFGYYAQLTGRKIQFHRSSRHWTVEIYSNGVYVCLGFGWSCEEAETVAQRNYNYNQKWNWRTYPPISIAMCNNIIT